MSSSNSSIRVTGKHTEGAFSLAHQVVLSTACYCCLLDTAGCC
jgi:hypothetical protein